MSAPRRWVLPVLAMVAPVLVASVRPKSGGTIQLSLPAAAAGVDPTRIETVAEGMLAGLVFDGLYAWEQPGEIPTIGMRETQERLSPGHPLPMGDAPRLVPRLAAGEPVPSADGKSFRIAIRPGARTHDGRPLRAADVAASLARTLQAAESRWVLAELDGASAWLRSPRGLPGGIAVASDSAIDLRFATAVGDPRRLLAAPPAAIVGPGSRPNRPLGTGPFRVEGIGAASGVGLRAHAACFAGPPFLDRVVAVPPRARNDEVRAFEVGQLWMSFHAPSVYGGTPRGGSRKTQGAAVHVVTLLPSSGSRLLRDPDARRAVSLAIDRGRLSRFAVTPVGTLPARPLPRNLSTARAAIARAAARAGIAGRPAVTLAPDPGDAIAASIAEVVVASLDEIGVDVRVVSATAGGAEPDLRLAIVLPAAPDAPGIVAAVLAAAGDGSRASSLLSRGDARAAEREGAQLAERGSAIVLGLRTPILHARASLTDLSFDPLGRLDLRSAWIP